MNTVQASSPCVLDKAVMTEPDSNVEVDVLRNGQPVKLDVSVIERPSEEELDKMLRSRRRSPFGNRNNR